MSDLPPVQPNENPVPPQAGAERVRVAPVVPRKKKRLWLRILGILVVLLIVLVLLAPTIASMGFVRSIVVGKVNDNLNGSVSIGSYSVGWLGGISASDVEVFDAQKNLILKLSQLKTQMSLLDAVRGNYALGDTVVDVDLVKAVIEPDGKLNYSELSKTTTGTEKPTGKSESKSAAQPPASPTKLPNVSGKLTVNYKGSVFMAGGAKPVMQIQPSTAVVNIPGINQTITNDINLAYAAADGPVGTLHLVGKADVAKNNQLDLDHLVADQKLDLSAIDLKALSAILKIVSPKTDLQSTGTASGSLAMNVNGLSDISAKGAINVASFTASGAPLATGDQLVINAIEMPIDVTQSTVNGKPNVNANISVLLNNGNLGKVQITANGQQDALMAAAKMVPAVAQHALSATKPSTETVALDGAGTAKISVALDLAAMANQLKNTIALQKGVALTAGHLTHETNIDLSKDTAKISTDTKLPDLAGTNDGKPVHLSPIDIAAAVTAVGGATPDLHDLSLKFTSAFLNATGGGASLSKEKITGDFDLSKLQGETQQFVDLDKMLNPPSTQPTSAMAVATAHAPVHFAGVGSFDLSTDGNLIQPDGQGKVATTLTINGVDASGIGTLPPVKLANLNATLNGDLHRGAQAMDYKNFTAALTAAGITLASNNGTAPILDNETVSANLAGDLSLPSGEGARSVRLSAVTLTSSSNLFSVKKTNADDFTVVTEKGSVRGNGTIALTADLKKLMDVGQRFSASSTTQPAVAATGGGAGDLQSGMLNGTLSLAHGTEPQTTVAFDGAVTNLTVTTAQKPISNETIKLTLHAISPDDKSSLKADGSIDSRFLSAKLTNVSALLTGTIWEKLQHLEATVDVPDLATADAILNAFSAPPAKVSFVPAGAYPEAFAAADTRTILLALADDAPPANETPEEIAREHKRLKAARGLKEAKAQPAAAAAPAPELPAAPLQVTSGSATIKLMINRDAKLQTTSLNLSDMTVSNLALQRGEQKYAFARPINFKLDAAVTAADKIQQVKVNSLTGDLVVANLTMPEPITISNLGDADKLDAHGTLKVNGKLGDATPFLAVYQNAKPMPYAGTYDLTQAIRTGAADQGKLMNLTGTASVSDFQVLGDDGKPAVSEPKIDVKNDVDYIVGKTDPATQKKGVDQAIVRSFSVDMTSSKALALAFVGRIKDVSGKRDLLGIGTDPAAKLDVTYDLAKLWPIIYPTLAPETQTKYKGLKIEGKEHEIFALSGSYPVAPNSYQSRSRLNIDGAVALDLLDLPQGLTITKFSLPFKMTNGVVQTSPGANQTAIDAPTTTKPIVAKTAVCNDGAVDLSEITLDMGKPSPVLTIVKNHKLLQDVKLNPVLADTLGAGNILFKDAKTANGLMNMTVVQCNNVPLGDLMNNGPKANAQITYSVTDLALDGPVPSAISGPLQLGGQGIHGAITDGKLTIADGVANNDFGLDVIRYTKMKSNGAVDNTDLGVDTAVDTNGNKLKAVHNVMKFSGGVDLATEALKDFAVNIPQSLLGGIDKNFAAALPAGLTVPFTGTASHFNFDFQKALIQNGGQNLLKGGLGNLIGGKKKGVDGASDATSDPNGSAAPANSDPLGGLIDSIGKKKPKKVDDPASIDRAAPDATSPPAAQDPASGSPDAPAKKKKKRPAASAASDSTAAPASQPAEKDPLSGLIDSLGKKKKK